MSNDAIPYNRPPVMGNELRYLEEVLQGRHFSGDGSFTKRCNRWLEEETKSAKVLLTHSCTAALEMSALLADLRPGDEVIMPSFTFVSTANAVALRGAVPVFIDIRPDTMNIDEKLIEGAVTSKTKAVFVVHYAGVGCEMDTIMELGRRYNFLVLEDAAQGLMATYKNRALGSIGTLGSLSFHETKNVVAGEGGALMINDPNYADRAEIIREKGTNRMQFFRGLIDKYTWVDIGSSYLPSEFNAAVLMAQLETAKEMTVRRRTIWGRYYEAFTEIENAERVRRPVIPEYCQHNGHIFYLITRDLEERTALMAHMKAAQIGTPFHYVPLHSAPAGRRFGRTHGSLSHTDACSDRLIRLPIWVGMDEEQNTRVIERVLEFYKEQR